MFYVKYTHNGPYSGNDYLGVVDNKIITLPDFSVPTIHAPQSTIWEFDIALKKMSPFKLFSTLDVSQE